MYFCSTRDKKLSVSSATAIAQGLSNDGGLFVPSFFPEVSKAELKEMLSMTYQERAMRILSKYLTDFTNEELMSCIGHAYGEQFETSEIAPVRHLDGFDVCELWHGPTCAFKDVALQILPHLLQLAVKKTGNNHKTLILVATSGDTGKAALEGFKNVDGISIAVFYPENGVSEIQKLQMATQEGNNVAVFAIRGNFDDAQSGVKAIFGDKAFVDGLCKNGYSFSSANSINFGRLVPQVVYYFSSYLDLVNKGRIIFGEPINFTVPTGNFGNILACYYAMRMGLPVHKMICASNRNRVLTDFIQTGKYDRKREFYLTDSPSMDILISSNLERLLYHISGEDDKLVADLMKQLSEGGEYVIPSKTKEELSHLFYGASADDEMGRQTISETYKKNGYVIDPHTAVAVSCYHQYVEKTGDKTPNVIMSTASPFKFSKAVDRALGVQENLDDFAFLSTLEQYAGKAPKQLSELKNKPIRFSSVYEKDNMKTAVLSVIK